MRSLCIKIIYTTIKFNLGSFAKIQYDGRHKTNVISSDQTSHNSFNCNLIYNSL